MRVAADSGGRVSHRLVFLAKAVKNDCSNGVKRGRDIVSNPQPLVQGARSKTAGRLVLALSFTCLSVALPRAASAGDSGERDFPATLVVQEPQVETEIAPQIARFGNGDARQTDLSTELSLQLAAPLSVFVSPDYTILRPGGSGFQALEVGFKYQFVTDAAHEIVVSAGVSSELGGIGSPLVDADTFTTIIPTLYLGKGAGDLPDALRYARPIAVTAQLGFAAPTRANRASSESATDAPFEAIPSTIRLQGSLQYSLPYLSEAEPTVAIPRALRGFVPLVEYDVEIPVANLGAHASTLGTINPGVLWVDGKLTLGLEALIPINRESGTHPGVRLQASYSFSTPLAAAEDQPR